MRVVDMHCDTILELLSRDLKGKEASLFSNDLSIDLKKMKKGNYLLQNFALFTDQKELAIPEQQTMRLYDEYCTQMDKYADYIAPVYTFSDIEKNDKEGKISSLLTLEDGGVCFLLMGIFYYLIDIKGWKYGIGWLKYYGMNSIAAYCLFEVVNFRCISDSLFFGLEQWLGVYYPLVGICFQSAIVLLIVKWMYDHKIFLKA